jgi:glycine cleavage system transcriptional repressor
MAKAWSIGGFVMGNWLMLTLVGKDQVGIVARVSQVLFDLNGNLGETSMTRLGGNFTIMLMVSVPKNKTTVQEKLQTVCDDLGLFFHLDEIEGELHQHIEPDVRISIHGADQAGIVARATGALNKAGLNILNLESDVGGHLDNPVYVMHIEGVAGNGLEPLEEALQTFSRENNVVAQISPIDTMVG